MTPWRLGSRAAAGRYWAPALPGTVILTREATTPDGRRGWRIVPEKAAEAIWKRTGGRRVGNLVDPADLNEDDLGGRP